MKEGKLTAPKNFICNTMNSKMVRNISAQIIYFVTGFLLSGSAVFGSYAPFGASVVAVVPYKKLISALAGTSLGYIIMMPSGSFRYIATILAICAIRWTLNDIKMLKRNIIFHTLLAFVPMLATGLVLVVIGGMEASLIAMAVIEALLSAIGAFFIYKTIIIFRGTRGITSLSQQEIACIAMTGCIFLLAFTAISFGGVSLGRIGAIIIIMLAARYGAVSGGCISGVATGVIFSMADLKLSFLSGAYAFGGLMSGLFAPVGKLAVAVVFVICHLVMAFQTDNTDLIIASVYEAVIAAVIFMLLPKDLGNRISQLFTPSGDKTKAEGLRKNVIMRLGIASKALSDVSSSVDTVAEKMKDIYSYDISSVYGQSAEEICSHCGLRAYCWEKQKQQSYADFNALTPILKKKGKIEEKDFSQAFAKKCCKTVEMANAINRNYESYIAYLSAERRVGEIRSVVAGQFSGLGDILAEMAEEFTLYERFDSAAADRVSNALKTEGLIPVDVSCRVDRLNRMTVEVEISNMDKNAIKKSSLVKEISKACGRMMDTPCISYIANSCKLQMSQRPVYDVQIGSCQHISGNGQLCGDSYNYFTDGMGRMIVIISDGMGTGGRAAVDGSMAENIMTKLVKAGLGFDCALKVVNSALMVKSGDESLATLDIACIDLFTGVTDIMKAGAPLTFVKKGDQVERIDFASLPTGILTDINLSHKSTQLVHGDWVVMVSDGAVATGEDWLEEMLKGWQKGSAQELSRAIVKEAQSRRSDGYDDDITAIAMLMLGNVRRS